MADNMFPTSETTTGRVVNIGTRKSQLALAQTEIIHKTLLEVHPGLDIRIHAMSTMGDKNLVTALHSFGAKNLWTHELESGLVKGELDLIVHSLKGGLVGWWGGGASLTAANGCRYAHSAPGYMCAWSRS